MARCGGKRMAAVNDAVNVGRKWYITAVKGMESATDVVNGRKQM